jgi:hypothetical protein
VGSAQDCISECWTGGGGKEISHYNQRYIAKNSRLMEGSDTTTMSGLGQATSECWGPFGHAFLDLILRNILSVEDIHNSRGNKKRKDRAMQ